MDPKLFLDAIDAAMQQVIKAEPEITRFDTIAGDGDAGALYAFLLIGVSC